MAKRKTNPEELKRSIRFKAKSIEDMKKLAAVRDISVSDLVREFVEKGLAVNGYKSDIDFITEIIHKEMINRSLRLGVEYMKKKDVEVDQYLSQADEVGRDSRRVK